MTTGNPLVALPYLLSVVRFSICEGEVEGHVLGGPDRRAPAHLQARGGGRGQLQALWHGQWHCREREREEKDGGWR